MTILMECNECIGIFPENDYKRKLFFGQDKTWVDWIEMGGSAGSFEKEIFLFAFLRGAIFSFKVAYTVHC